MSGGVRRLVPLTYGWEDLPKSISVHGADPGIRLREPVPGVLCQLDGGWLLLDTGFNDPLVRDPALCRRFHGRNHDIHAELLPGDGDSLETAFETVGIDPDDVVAVALSHLHNDHVGGSVTSPSESRSTASGESWNTGCRAVTGFHLFALNVRPPKSGLVKVEHEGASIEAEVWELPAEAFADLVGRVPEPLSIGPVELVDGTSVPGFLCRSIGLPGSQDITPFGGAPS